MGVLTWVCALFLHDLTKGHLCRCNEASTFSTFGFALGLVPDIELDLGLVVCMMTVGGVGINKIHGRCDSQKGDFPLIWILTVYSKHDFMLVQAVDLHCNDGSPGLFRT